MMSPSDRSFVVPGGLTLDNDSEIDQSKLTIREKMKNAQTTRNSRNKTIDIPMGQDIFSSKKKSVGGRSTLRNIN